MKLVGYEVNEGKKRTGENYSYFVAYLEDEAPINGTLVGQRFEVVSINQIYQGVVDLSKMEIGARYAVIRNYKGYPESLIRLSDGV